MHIPDAALQNLEKQVFFQQSYKEMMTLERMCTSGRMKNLVNFCHEVSSLKFESEPNYSKLIKMLEDLHNLE